MRVDISTSQARGALILKNTHRAEQRSGAGERAQSRRGAAQRRGAAARSAGSGARRRELGDSLLPAYFLPTSCLLPAYFLPTSCLLPAYFLAAAQRRRSGGARSGGGQRAAAAERRRRPARSGGAAAAQRRAARGAQSKILRFLPTSKLRSECSGMHLPQKYIFSGDFLTWTLKLSPTEIYFSATLSL